MWRNLASNTFEKLSNVVAPQEESDTDEENDEYLEDEDIDSTTGDGDEDEDGGTFGFVGMLTKALDNEEEEHDEYVHQHQGLHPGEMEEEDSSIDEDEATDTISDDGIESTFENMQNRLLDKETINQNEPTSPTKGKSNSSRSITSNSSGEVRMGLRRESGSITPMQQKKESVKIPGFGPPLHDGDEEDELEVEPQTPLTSNTSPTKMPSREESDDLDFRRRSTQGIAGKSNDSILDEIYYSKRPQRFQANQDESLVNAHPTIPMVPDMELKPNGSGGRFSAPKGDTIPHLPQHPPSVGGRDSRRSSVNSRRSSFASQKSTDSVLDETFPSPRNRPRPMINLASSSDDTTGSPRRGVAKKNSLLGSLSFTDGSPRRGVQKHNSLLGSISFQIAEDDLEAKEFLMLHDEAAQELQDRCEDLEEQLIAARYEIEKLKATPVSQGGDEDKLRIEFQEKEVRLLEAAQEDHEMEMRQVKESMQIDIDHLKHELEQERRVFDSEKDRFERMLKEAQMKTETATREKEMVTAKLESEATQFQKQQIRDLRITEDRLAQTMAQLDDKNAEVKELKKKVKQLESSMSEHQHGAQEIEEEIDEIHQENEDLRNHAEAVEAQCAELQARLVELQSDSEKLSHLKMELRMVKEDLDRERNKNQSVTASAETNYVQIQSERDAALAAARDMEAQLQALRADLDLSKADYERIVQANTNLQSALESFQSEREAELAMIEEQRLESEEALNESHKATLHATKQAHQAQMKQLQEVSDAAVRNSMNEIKALEEKIESYRLENVQMRRSLDEAIQRLQNTQEDIIDRTLMKNILLDWLTKRDAKEKRDVLDLMASVLHFTEEEKERVHIGGGGIGKVVGSVAKLPPSKVDPETLEGDNVREKWVNFLLAETDD